MVESKLMQMIQNSSIEKSDTILSQTNDSLGMNLTLNTKFLNVSSMNENINSFYFYEREQFMVLGFLFFGIIIGNGAVLSALLLGKSRKSRMNYFIMHLAIADLLVGLISVGTDIAWRFTVEWLAGNLACKFIRYLQAAVTYSSTYVLVALSIDRYDAITHPMNFSRSWFRARCLVVGAWCLSLLFATPNGFLFKESVIQSKVQCWCHLNSQQWQIYISLVSVALFILPTLIISACYASIVHTIWSKSKQLTPAIPRLNEHFDENEDTRRASSRGLIPRAKIKTIKMTFVIVFVFILCWSPYIMFGLLQVFGHIPNTQTNIAVATFIQSLAPLNSAANPVIYCAFSSHIHGNLRKIPPLKWIYTGPYGGRFGNSRTNTSSLTEVISSRLRSFHINTRSHSVHTIDSHKL